VASTHGRLRLFQFPAYSPELNPDEWVWKERQKPTASVAPVSDQAKGNLRSKAVAAMRRLQKLPCLIRGFFADPICVTSQPDVSITYAPLVTIFE